MKLNTLERLERFLRYFFVVITIAAGIYSVIHRDWETMFSSFLIVFLFLLPSIYSRRTKISIPTVIQIIILFFIFASMYLGEIHGYFYRYRWWDTMLHSSSALILGYIGFLLIYALNKDKAIELKLSPFFMAFFAFCFAMTIGVLWEIFEYLADQLFGANMQKARNLEELYGVFDTRLGVIDTMRDLIVDAIGAFIVSAIGYNYMKRKDKDSVFIRLKDQFVEENPDLFEEEGNDTKDN